MIEGLENFVSAWVNPKLLHTTLEVSSVVGSSLFFLDLESALIKGNTIEDKDIAI